MSLGGLQLSFLQVTACPYSSQPLITVCCILLYCQRGQEQELSLWQIPA